MMYRINSSHECAIVSPAYEYDVLRKYTFLYFQLLTLVKQNVSVFVG